MTALLYLAAYLLCGAGMAHWLLPRQRALYRLWLGLAMGLYLLMWLPALMAFVDAFSVRGHLLALAALALLTRLAWLLRDRRTALKWAEEDSKDARVLLLVALPLSVLAAWLQYTHNLRPVGEGLFVGQSTYGDLPLHTGIVTSLRNARFPADYSILPGQRLSYPFLADSLSTSFMLFNMNLQGALNVPGTLMAILVFCGYTLFALRVAGRRRAAMLSVLLLFINGGLGFLYSFDIAGVSLGSPGTNQLQSGTWLQRLQTILHGFYQTPVNHAEFSTYNLRWSNIIADMLIPQRTFLAGWAMLFPCLYLLWEGMREQQPLRHWLLLGLLAGGLPLIHTHTFLALGLCSAGFLAVNALQRRNLRPFLLYGLVACALAAPQLLAFTFRQAGGSERFLRVHFNWVNNLGGQGLQDGYLWFYIKNVGLPFLLMVFGLLERNAKHRLMYAGAFTIFIAAELVLFQPNAYDNNKLFYVWYALVCIPVSEYAFQLYDRLKGLRARPLMAIAACFVFFVSGGLSIARESISAFEAYGPPALAAARYAEEQTPEHSLFMTHWDQHLNPVSALAGRSIVCGPDLWLYYHGFDTDRRKQDISRFYQAPETAGEVIARYGVQYVLLGPAERQAFGAEEAAFSPLFEEVYRDQYGEYIIYRVPEG